MMWMYQVRNAWTDHVQLFWQVDDQSLEIFWKIPVWPFNPAWILELFKRRIHDLARYSTSFMCDVQVQVLRLKKSNNRSFLTTSKLRSRLIRETTIEQNVWLSYKRWKNIMHKCILKVKYRAYDHLVAIIKSLFSLFIRFFG